MATVKKGINGGFTGKVGNVIGYQLNGKWVIRGLPKISRKNKKGTQEQQTCRSAYTKMQYFLHPILDFIRIGFHIESRKRMMTAHNVAKSHNMLFAQTADGEIDYAKVCLTYGSLIGVENPAFSIQLDSLHFTWTDNTNKKWQRASDEIMIVAYNLLHKKSYTLINGARRNKKFEMLPLPLEEKGNQFHIWISFKAKDEKGISMSTFMGDVVF